TAFHVDLVCDQGFRAPGRQHRGIDPETWVYSLDLVAQKLDDVRRVARGARESEADRLHAVVRPEEQKIESARAFLAFLELVAQRRREQADRALQVVRRADGLGEGQPLAFRQRRQYRFDGLRSLPQGLVQ